MAAALIQAQAAKRNLPHPSRRLPGTQSLFAGEDLLHLLCAQVFGGIGRVHDHGDAVHRDHHRFHAFRQFGILEVPAGHADIRHTVCCILDPG